MPSEFELFFINFYLCFLCLECADFLQKIEICAKVAVVLELWNLAHGLEILRSQRHISFKVDGAFIFFDEFIELRQLPMFSK